MNCTFEINEGSTETELINIVWRSEHKLNYGTHMKYIFLSALAATLIFGGTVMAQSQTPLSAQASDPKTLDWMQGFPPPQDKTIRFTDPDYFAFPKLRWTVCNFRQLMPSVGVSNGSMGASKLPITLDSSLDQVSFIALGSGKKNDLGCSIWC